MKAGEKGVEKRSTRLLWVFYSQKVIKDHNSFGQKMV